MEQLYWFRVHRSRLGCDLRVHQEERSPRIVQCLDVRTVAVAQERGETRGMGNTRHDTHERRRPRPGSQADERSTRPGSCSGTRRSRRRSTATRPLDTHSWSWQLGGDVSEAHHGGTNGRSAMRSSGSVPDRMNRFVVAACRYMTPRFRFRLGYCVSSPYTTYTRSGRARAPSSATPDCLLVPPFDHEVRDRLRPVLKVDVDEALAAVDVLELLHLGGQRRIGRVDGPVTEDLLEQDLPYCAGAPDRVPVQDLNDNRAQVCAPVPTRVLPDSVHQRRPVEARRPTAVAQHNERQHRCRRRPAPAALHIRKHPNARVK